MLYSLERIQQYLEIEQEAKPTEAGVPPAYWPASGALTVEKLSARYSPVRPPPFTPARVVLTISLRMVPGFSMSSHSRSSQANALASVRHPSCQFSISRLLPPYFKSDAQEVGRYVIYSFIECRY